MKILQLLQQKFISIHLTDFKELNESAVQVKCEIQKEDSEVENLSAIYAFKLTST